MRRYLLASLVAVLCGGGAFALAATASPPKPGGSYRGKTTQDRGVTLRVGRSGTVVTDFRISRDMTCRKGDDLSSIDGRSRLVRSRIQIDRNGHFHGHLPVVPAGGSLVRRGRLCIRGRFTRGGRVVRARYRERLRLRDGALCGTGSVRLSARLVRHR